jgi:hypothetical protein
MSNNDEMDVRRERPRTWATSPEQENEEHGVRGKTGGFHGTSENEREQQGLLKQCHSQYILGATTLTKITSSGPK